MTYGIIKRLVWIALTTVIAVGCVAGQVSLYRADKAYHLGDYETAATEYQDAVASGNVEAMYHLGAMYVEGEGVPKDTVKGAGLVKQAADSGLADAQLMYGLFNVYGDGVPMDPPEGIRWLNLAAEQDNDIAMYYLGILHAMGLGVSQDTQTALMWMNKAKQNGFPVKDELLTVEGLKALSKN